MVPRQIAKLRSMIGILGLFVLMVFVLAMFVGNRQEKIWMRWGLWVAFGIVLAAVLAHVLMRR